MATVQGEATANRRQGRRWHFAGAVLDELSWTLCVDGRRVPLEAKPLELLHELLLRAGEAVSKDALLDAVWPGVSVVEASLPTAMTKLRRALGDEGIIETVPRIGYRLAVPVAIEAAEPRSPPAPAAGGPAASPGPEHSRPRLIAVGAVLLAVVAASWVGFRALSPAAAAPLPVTRLEAIEALRALDVPQVRTLLSRGWDPNAALDGENNGAIDVALEICEWNPGHDRRQLLLLTRMLVDGGARLLDRNVWGDTPYSIASARRYCGPDHPATQLLRSLCYDGAGAPRERCLADYAHARRRLPPGT